MAASIALMHRIVETQEETLLVHIVTLFQLLVYKVTLSTLLYIVTVVPLSVDTVSLSTF